MCVRGVCNLDPKLSLSPAKRLLCRSRESLRTRRCCVVGGMGEVIR